MSMFRRTAGRAVIAAAVLALAAGAVRAAPYVLDPARSAIRFEIGAEGYPLTRGQFRKFTSNLAVDFDHPARSKVSFKVEAASLDTGLPMLDSYVRSDAFLNTERFPAVSFESTAVEKLDDHRVQVTGILTLLGVSRPEVFVVDVDQSTGKGALGLTARGHIHRSDFGMTAGLPLISDDVAITVAALADTQ
ncbi:MULTISPECIES: YceI family protein [Azorhizobium]|uniref:YceI family protein n=1 Tax=Azorhizobium TaxID=6 RepID=UPI00105B8603|nr:YceI family protein [Azorhizobium sp. AG788]TDU00654.1 polyisoprenoid-binding protein YceI [Azorhizobium sp. AG788]